MADHDETPPIHVNPEKLLFASILEWGLRLGAVMLAAAGAIYFLELLPANVAPGVSAAAWSLSTERYVAVTGAPTGWAWIRHLDRSDGLAMLGFAWLSGIVVPAYVALLPAYRRKGWWTLLAIVLIEIAVVLLAASNLLQDSTHG